MFSLKRLKDWSCSSVNDDKKELTVYQSLNDQILSINSKIDEYINEFGTSDSRLLILYDGKLIGISFLNVLKNSVLKDKSLSVEQRANKSDYINRCYIEELKKLREKIVSLAIMCTDNIYLVYINSCIEVINGLLKKYNYLLAIQRANISSINNSGNLNAGQKLVLLKEQIDIRESEINRRLATVNIKR